MNSFTITAIGNLSRDPELVVRDARTCAKFCLIGNDYAAHDESAGGREIVTSLWFIAFGPLAEVIARNARKGDQLIVEAQVRVDSRTDRHGRRHSEHSYIVQGFRFGAPGKLKRSELAERLRGTVSVLPGTRTAQPAP